VSLLLYCIDSNPCIWMLHPDFVSATNTNNWKMVLIQSNLNQISQLKHGTIQEQTWPWPECSSNCCIQKFLFFHKLDIQDGHHFRKNLT
jgi:hypothetical protein